MSQAQVRVFYRVDLAGGWTDVPPLYDNAPGVVLTVSLTKGITLTAALAGERGVAQEDQQPEPMSGEAGASFFSRAAWAVGQKFGPWPSVIIRARADCPAGAGLGSSGALLGGLVLLHHELRGLACAPLAAAVEARKLEVEALGHAAGWQDPIAACLGGFLGQKFEKTQENILHLAMSQDFIRGLLARSLVVLSGQRRVSGDTVAEVARKFAQGQAETVAAAEQIRAAAKAAVHAIMAGDERGLLAVVAQNAQAQARLHPHIHHPVYDDMKSRLGPLCQVLKPLGAGGGGSAWVVLPTAQQLPQAQELLGNYESFVPELAAFRGPQ